MSEEEPKVVAKISTKTKGVKIGKPQKHPRVVMGVSKVAFPAAGGVSMGSGGNFYSPELSPDFLELPQSVDEQRNFYRYFYDNDPFVGQAIDLHTELPLSKIRLRKPKAKNKKLAERAQRFCERWARQVGLLHRLMEILHDLNLIGEANIFAEDPSPDPPREVTEERVMVLQDDGALKEEWRPYADATARLAKWTQENYKGWTALRVLPPEQVVIETFPFTDRVLIELVPDSKTKALFNRMDMGDSRAAEVVDSMPADIVEYLRSGSNIPLNTNPHAGSFVYHMSRKKSQYEARGKSILQRCLRTLVFRDKLRQAQTSIASRHMTPYRLIYAEDMSSTDVEELRAQVDYALQDPDFSIVTNFPVTWEEKGGGNENRLLDLTSEYDVTDRQLYAGLSMTESLLSGESSYSGDRIHLEVINVRFMLVRELLQDFVDNYLLAPMCARMGFVEEDEDGNEVVIHPRLSFTRLALRDNQETFDALWNLYSKGSLDIDTILDLLNIDPDTVEEKLKRDVLTLKDATFNEVLRTIYSSAGQQIVEGSDITKRIAEALGITYEKKEEGNDRFGM